MLVLLQWGRGLLAAEIYIWTYVCSKCTASMGPRLISRGDSFTVATFRLRWPLQWGRGLLAAEIRFSPPSPSLR